MCQQSGTEITKDEHIFETRHRRLTALEPGLEDQQRVKSALSKQAAFTSLTVRPSVKVQLIVTLYSVLPLLHHSKEVTKGEI